MKENNRIKTKIGVGSVVKTEVVKMEDNTREGIIRRIRKEVVGCVQAVLGKNKFLVIFEYGQNREMSYISLSYPCPKQEVCLDMDDPKLDLPKK